MLFIKFKELDFESELLDLIEFFFPGTGVTVLKDGEQPGFAEICLYGGFKGINGAGAYSIKYISGTNELEHFVPIPGGIPGKSDIETRKAFKIEVRRGIYLLLSRATGKRLPWGMLTGIRPAKIVHELMEKGYAEPEIHSRLKDYYCLSREKARLLYEVAAAEKGLLETSSPDSVSIYIGIPFCNSRCLYCSFTSYPIHRYSGLVGNYFNALKRELKSVNEIIAGRKLKIQSLYIGGGTPTSVEACDLEDLLEFIEAGLDISGLQEYTLEAGRPDSIDAEKLAAIKKSAVNRISINPQTMSNETLKLIGRGHTREELICAYELARDMGFKNINMDVIIGLPGEDAGVLENTLEELRRLDPESMTVHTMALKRASRLKTEKTRYPLISENEAVKMIDKARRFAGLMGMHPYYLYRQKNMLGNLENVGYCKPGCESIYNVQIMEEKQTIIAAGAGAVTKVVYPDENRIERAFNVKGVEEYIARIDEMIDRKKALL